MQSAETVTGGPGLAQEPTAMGRNLGKDSREHELVLLAAARRERARPAICELES